MGASFWTTLNRFDDQARELRGVQGIREFLQLGLECCVIFAAEDQTGLARRVEQSRPAFRDEDCDTAILLMSRVSTSPRPDPRRFVKHSLKEWLKLDADPSDFLDVLERFKAEPQHPHCPGPRLLQIEGTGWHEHQNILRAGFRGHACIRVEPRHEGKSGAFVGIIHATDCDGQPLPGAYVAKVRPERKLTSEIRAIEKIARRFLDERSYNPIGQSLYDEVDRKTMIVMPAVLTPSGEVLTLRSMYALGAGLVVPVVQQLLGDLDPWMRKAEQRPYPIATAYLALVEQDPARRDVLSQRLSELGIAQRAFIEDLAAWAKQRGLVCSRFGMAHGDLHGGNVLIGPDERPRLIDFSRGSTSHPAAMDGATLILDILWHGMTSAEACEVLGYALAGRRVDSPWAVPLHDVAATISRRLQIDVREFWASVMFVAMTNLSYEDVERREELGRLIRELKNLLGAAPAVEAGSS